MTRLYLEDFAVGQKYGTRRLRVDAEAIKALRVFVAAAESWFQVPSRSAGIRSLPVVRQLADRDGGHSGEGVGAIHLRLVPAADGDIGERATGGAGELTWLMIGPVSIRRNGSGAVGYSQPPVKPARRSPSLI